MKRVFNLFPTLAVRGRLFFFASFSAAAHADTADKTFVSRTSEIDQAVFPRFNNCCFVLPVFQAGGSLAGKDSRDASSTMSSTSSCGGGSCGSIGAGGVS